MRIEIENLKAIPYGILSQLGLVELGVFTGLFLAIPRQDLAWYCMYFVGGMLSMLCFLLNGLVFVVENLER